MLKRLSDLNPFRSPGAESSGSAEVALFFALSRASLDTCLFPVQDEDAEYEQLKKDVMANTRRLVLEPFIIATAAAVGLNFGAYALRVTDCAQPSCSRVRTGTSNVIYFRRSQAVGCDNLYFPIRKKVKLLVSFACARLRALLFTMPATAPTDPASASASPAEHKRYSKGHSNAATMA